MSVDMYDGDIIVPGEKIYLGQVREDLVPVYRRWVNDLRTSRTLGLVNDVGLPLTDADERDWLDGVRKDSSQALFTIYERESGDAVGNAGLTGVRSLHRSAEFGIVIGERSKQGLGYGTEATRLMIDYGFNVIGLHHIWLRCVEFNKAGIRAYEKAGFQHTGRFRQGWRLGQKQYDVVLMDILADEFESPVLKDLLDVDDRNE